MDSNKQTQEKVEKTSCVFDVSSKIHNLYTCAFILKWW
jgi:hypothetical protein